MKNSKRVISLILVLCLAFSFCAMAEETADKAKVVFQVSEVDENGNFNVDLTIYNSTFKGFLGTLVYDKAVVAPAGETFEEFASIPAKAYDGEEEVADWLVGKSSKVSEGKIDLVYVLNTKAKYPNSIVSAKFQALASENGLTVASMKFKKLADGKPAFNVEKSNISANGFSLVNSNGLVSCDVHINVPESMGESVVISIDGTVKTVASDESEADEETMRKRVQRRSNGTLFLQVGNYATVSDSLLKWIDKDNKAVMPYIKDNRTYVPLRFIAEELNSKVSYNGDTREVTIETAKTILIFKIGSTEYTDDGLKKTTDAAPEIVNNRTFVPIRVVSEALNRSVEWLGTDKMVVITAKDYPWDNENKVEKDLLNEIKLMISPMLRDFAYGIE